MKKLQLPNPTSHATLIHWTISCSPNISLLLLQLREMNLILPTLTMVPGWSILEPVTPPRSIIYATHVGSSRLGTLIHYVPRSAVKLVSVGALTAFGYMVHTERDRSIVITAPTWSILCSCPIQSNNTWIFPAHLMSGKISPTTAVSTGISGTPNATVLPFSIPREGRHFTKEEVKRATQSRQLHHFLCHPNNEALKSTLDQGSLSHHTHLTSHDIDLMTDFFGSCMACTIGKLHYHDLHFTSIHQHRPMHILWLPAAHHPVHWWQHTSHYYHRRSVWIHFCPRIQIQGPTWRHG